MLLTVPQKYLKDLLKDFGALKKNQVESLLKIKDKYSNYERTVIPMINGREAMEKGEYLTTYNSSIVRENIIAIDIMLMIENENVEVIQKGNAPFTLTFFKKRSDKLWRFDVCVVKPGYEMVLTAALEGINPKYRTIIFVLENPEQQENLIAPCDYCFAWKQNGEYHFYKELR